MEKSIIQISEARLWSMAPHSFLNLCFKSSKFAHDDAAQQALNHFTTFTLSTMDMQNTKQRKVSTMSSSSSSSDNGMEFLPWLILHCVNDIFIFVSDVPNKNNELSSPTLAEEKMTTALPDPMYADNYLLCNKEIQHTSIPTTMLPKESVVLPINDKKWTIVSLE
ncbi:hypothetical protein OSB04_030143 [Centaurea solstitialis]|uniref:Uncharacterized protein n=1 Tax=Centaurea solstitialis TaxID=347529 RepID=A0AA38W3J0_9ASTR|nr:hypothetical protein OSB04_030143 [Centaurea solstitialis]